LTFPGTAGFVEQHRDPDLEAPAAREHARAARHLHLEAPAARTLSAAAAQPLLRK